MQLLIDTYKKTGNLHHAYLIEGERSSTVKTLFDFLENEVGVKKAANPDFWHGQFDSFGIDDGRLLKEMQEKKAFSGKKIFVLEVNALTHQAQNSLLKMFEEPTSDTHFFLVLPSLSSLLPTLRSRFMVIERKSEDTVGVLARQFLLANKGERLKLAKEFADEISDEKKVKADAALLLGHLELLLKEKLGKKAMGRDEAQIFSELISARSYLGDTSPSVKMLLEHVALVLPDANQRLTFFETKIRSFFDVKALSLEPNLEYVDLRYIVRNSMGRLSELLTGL